MLKLSLSATIFKTTWYCGRRKCVWSMLAYVPVLRYGPIESTVLRVFLGRSVVSGPLTLKP